MSCMHVRLCSAAWPLYPQLPLAPSPPHTITHTLTHTHAHAVRAQTEIRKENTRQEMLAHVKDDRERVRLARIFSVERQMARENILSATNHVSILA
jgi:hypothetical protein